MKRKAAFWAEGAGGRSRGASESGADKQEARELETVTLPEGGRATTEIPDFILSAEESEVGRVPTS